MGKGANAFYVLDSKLTDKKIWIPVERGKRSERGDNNITSENVTYIKRKSGNGGIKRVLLNNKGKYREPNEKELRMIYGNNKRKANHMISIGGERHPFYPSNWDTKNNCVKGKARKKRRVEKTKKDLQEEVKELRKRLEKMDKEKSSE